MTRAYAATHPQLRQAILEAVAAGATVSEVCARPNMPARITVYGWARREPAFAAALDLARRQGDHRRRLTYDEAAARRIVARMAAGERIKAILREPGMPSQAAWRHWRMTQVELQEHLWRLRLAQRRELAYAASRRRRPFDPVLGDRLLVRLGRGEPLAQVLRSEPGAPGKALFHRWRAETPAFDRDVRLALAGGSTCRGRTRRRANLTPALAEQICERLRMGASLADLARQPDMPCATTLYAWVAHRPDFAAEVAQACEDREDWYEDHIAEIIDAPGPLAARRRAARPLIARLGRLRRRPGRRWRADTD